MPAWERWPWWDRHHEQRQRSRRLCRIPGRRFGLGRLGGSRRVRLERWRGRPGRQRRGFSVPPRGPGGAGGAAGHRAIGNARVPGATRWKRMQWNDGAAGLAGIWSGGDSFFPGGASRSAVMTAAQAEEVAEEQGAPVRSVLPRTAVVGVVVGAEERTAGRRLRHRRGGLSRRVRAELIRDFRQLHVQLRFRRRGRRRRQRRGRRPWWPGRSRRLGGFWWRWWSRRRRWKRRLRRGRQWWCRRTHRSGHARRNGHGLDRGIDHTESRLARWRRRRGRQRGRRSGSQRVTRSNRSVAHLLGSYCWLGPHFEGASRGFWTIRRLKRVHSIHGRSTCSGVLVDHEIGNPPEVPEVACHDFVIS